MPSRALSFCLVVLADTLLCDPELKPLPFGSGWFQPYRVSPFIHDIQ